MNIFLDSSVAIAASLSSTGDFRDLLGQTIYGLRVLTPGDFLRIEREA